MFELCIFKFELFISMLNLNLSSIQQVCLKKNEKGKKWGQQMGRGEMDPAVVGAENGGARSLLSADIWG